MSFRVHPAHRLLRHLRNGRPGRESTTDYRERGTGSLTPVASVTRGLASAPNHLSPPWDLSTEWFDRSFAEAQRVVGATSEADLYAPIPDDRIMPGSPRIAVISGIVDHTAHHRGSLAVYARLLGKEPPMPYG